MLHTSLVHNRISVLWPVSVEWGREQHYPLIPLSPAVCSHNGPHCLMLDTKWVQLLQVIDWRCTAQLPFSTWPPEFWCGEFHKNIQLALLAINPFKRTSVEVRSCTQNISPPNICHLIFIFLSWRRDIIQCCPLREPHIKFPLNMK